MLRIFLFLSCVFCVFSNATYLIVETYGSDDVQRSWNIPIKEYEEIIVKTYFLYNYTERKFDIERSVKSCAISGFDCRDLLIAYKFAQEAQKAHVGNSPNKWELMLKQYCGEDGYKSVIDQPVEFMECFCEVMKNEYRVANFKLYGFSNTDAVRSFDFDKTFTTLYFTFAQHGAMLAVGEIMRQEMGFAYSFGTLVAYPSALTALNWFFAHFGFHVIKFYCTPFWYFSQAAGHYYWRKSDPAFQFIMHCLFSGFSYCGFWGGRWLLSGYMNFGYRWDDSRDCQDLGKKLRAILFARGTNLNITEVKS